MLKVDKYVTFKIQMNKDFNRTTKGTTFYVSTKNKKHIQSHQRFNCSLHSLSIKMF